MNLSQPIFQVDQLRVERGTLILDQVSWRVERGQHLVIFGAKGCLLYTSTPHQTENGDRQVFNAKMLYLFGNFRGNPMR